ncbi:AAA family ATPase [Rhodothermus marinus]|uniref:AAA family ATPase n=1 Tax=Rhodothermus marinus TaxID=29549 RepID=UPI001FB32C92|nr:AAA family ATPase [Rhodothermus marinus]
MVELSGEQQRILDQLLAWLDRPEAPPIFILTGSAGTGKTLLIRHLVQALHQRRIKYALAAPTGRAARLLADRTGEDARTLHSLIYILDRYQLIEETEAQAEDPLSLRLHFALRSAELDARLIIVDEAPWWATWLASRNCIGLARDGYCSTC